MDLDDVIAEAKNLVPVEKARRIRDLLSSAVPTQFHSFFLPKGLTVNNAIEYGYYKQETPNAKSIAVMVDILASIQAHLPAMETFKSFTCRDVGTRMEARASLLAALYTSNFFLLQLEVDTIDIDSVFKDCVQGRFPSMRQSLIGDVFEVASSSYVSIVYCHTIEHPPLTLFRLSIAALIPCGISRSFIALITKKPLYLDIIT